MSETLDQIFDRIAKKSAAINADKTKLANLRGQVSMYETSIEKTESSLEMKEEELEDLITLRIKAEVLVRERDRLQKYTDDLRDKFDAIEWYPGIPWEKTLESTDYAEKIREKQAVNAEILEVGKAANRVYYRR